ncbi:MAG: ABC transporter substrate-binding protein [Alphaproteobacteria bacterium]|nr:ABC transporter substrate-binding protein [Alphaproteobacteria bacterium]
MKKVLLLAAAFLGLLATSAMADNAKPPIKIGYINDLTGLAKFARPNSQGIQLAVDEINNKGGVLGRKLEIVTRDGQMDPGESVRLAEELHTRDKVDALINCCTSGTSIAVGEWAKQNHMPFIVTASEADSIIWQSGNDFMARTNPGGYSWISSSLMKAVDVYGDKLKNKRWVSIAVNLEFGHSLVQSAKDIAAAKGLNAKWVAEQWPVYDKLSAGPTIATLEQANPDVVLVLLYGTDVVKFVREAKMRDFIKNRIFIFPLLALPEHSEMLGAEMPKGWISVGYPYDEVKLKKPALADFLRRYETTFHEPAKSGYAVTGYNGIKAIAAAIEIAGSTDPEKIRVAFDDLHFDTPYGEETLRKIDHQATVPYWVGLSDVIDGKPQLSDWTEYNAGDNSPPDAVILKLRGGK